MTSIVGCKGRWQCNKGCRFLFPHHLVLPSSLLVDCYFYLFFSFAVMSNNTIDVDFFWQPTHFWMHQHAAYVAHSFQMQQWQSQERRWQTILTMGCEGRWEHNKRGGFFISTPMVPPSSLLLDCYFYLFFPLSCLINKHCQCWFLLAPVHTFLDASTCKLCTPSRCDGGSCNKGGGQQCWQQDATRGSSTQMRGHFDFHPHGSAIITTGWLLLLITFFSCCCMFNDADFFLPPVYISSYIDT